MLTHLGSCLVTTNAFMNTSDACWCQYVRGENVLSIAQTIKEPVESIVARLERCMEQSDTQPPRPRAYLEKLVDEMHLVRQAAWMAWERSLQDKVKTTEKTITDPKGGIRREEMIVTESQTGDAAFLRIIIDCNRREAALRGLEKSPQLQSRLSQPTLDLDTLITQMEAAMRLDLHEPGK